jgi:uncharacterized protein (TIGR02117 family)
MCKWGLRALGALGVLVAGYLAAAVGLGLLPANREAAPVADGVEIAFTSNGFHVDVILPMTAAGVDWTQWCPPDAFGGVPAGHLAFGWGDRAFYLETPRYADIRPLTALHAVLWSPDTVLHVTYVDDPNRLAGLRRITVAPETYRRLAAYIAAGFRRDADGRPMLRPERGYGARDAFYAAVGTYSPFRTCNEWLAEGLRQAGIRTGWWAPFAFGVTVHL